MVEAGSTSISEIEWNETRTQSWRWFDYLNIITTLISYLHGAWYLELTDADGMDEVFRSIKVFTTT
jgi:hypothetical protein